MVIEMSQNKKTGYQLKVFLIVIMVLTVISLAIYGLTEEIDNYRALIITNWSQSQLKFTEDAVSKVKISMQQAVESEGGSISAAEHAVKEQTIKNLFFSNGSYFFFYNKNYIIFEQNDIVTRQYAGKTPDEAFGIWAYNGSYDLKEVLSGIQSGKSGYGFYVKNHKKGREHVSWVPFLYNGSEYILGTVTPESYILNEYKFDTTTRELFLFTTLLISCIVIAALLLCLFIYNNSKIITKLEEEIEYKSQSIYELTSRLDNEELKFKNLSTNDPMTGVYNRRFFDAFITRLELKSLLPISIVICDINGLKAINSRSGYDFGDRVLKETASIMTANCRSGDVLARYGNDQFIIVMTNTTEKYADELIKKMNNEFKEKFNNETHVTLSFGTASKNYENESIQNIISIAEQNLIIVKLNSRESGRYNNIEILKKTLVERTHETEDHFENMKAYMQLLGQAMDLRESVMAELSLLACLHDIGEIAISDRIFTKTGILKDNEQEIIKAHAVIGYNIASSSADIKAIAIPILQHHERWDGKGYPLGLKGVEITIQARIISVVDAFDAMVNGRAYKKAQGMEYALKEIENCAGTQFDPVIALLFVKTVRNYIRNGNI